MNSAEILKQSKTGIDGIGKKLFGVLTVMGQAKNLDIGMMSSAIVEGEKEVHILGMLRFLNSKNVATYALGYSDPNFLKLWNDLFPQTPEANPPGKTHEFELMKNYFMALDGELKAQGINIDPKSAMIQEGGQIGEWALIKVPAVAQITFTTPKGNLVFEIPLFDQAFAKQFALDKYGFREDARFMVVDDSLVSRKYSRSCLAMAGYFNIEECPDGDIAYAKIQGSSPRFECVVADWHMPNMSGLELLRKVRAIDEFKKLPIIMLTGEKNKEEVVSALKEGVSGYLVKPATYDSFFKALKKAGGRV